MQERQLLKRDLFGEVWRVSDDGHASILRDAGAARWWTAPVARWLLRREAAALAALCGIDGVPQLLHADRKTLSRSFIAGRPLYDGGAPHARYFRDAARILRRLHRAGVAHNDLAKEPNLLVTPDAKPALIDFQLASRSRRRGKLFRLAAREDLRHLAKHKRTYFPDVLTLREQRLLANPSGPSRLYRATLKPVYRFVTRRLLGWADREGAADRGRHD